MKQLILDVSIPSHASFDNFIAGRNAHVVALIQNIQGGRAIYLWGEMGSGRTHLLKAATQTSGTLYLNPQTPDWHFQTAINGLACCVAIDDIHLMNDGQLNAVFAIYNRWRSSAATARAFALIISGDKSPQHLKIREDLRTRVGWDLSFKLEPLSDNEKMDVIYQMSAERGVMLPDDVVVWLINHYDRNMQSLRQIIESLDHYSIETKRPITIHLTKEFLTMNPINPGEN